MIPEEAVEAAAEVVLSGMDEGYHAYKIAYAALEAAAPHMDYRGVNLEAVRAKRDWKVGDPE